MKNVFIILVLVVAVSCTTSAQEKKQKTSKKEMTKKTDKIVKTEAEWKASLTAQEYYVLREKGTDRPPGMASSKDGQPQ
jgi:peptide-methionine (R)-S-oxide reductase